MSDVVIPAQGDGGSVNAVIETISGVSGANRQVIAQAGLPVTPRALNNAIISVGGTPVVAVAGPISGGFITNPGNLSAQGIGSAENMYLDMVGVPGSTDAAGNGTTTILFPGQSFDLPALASGVFVTVNAATSGHKFSGEVW